MFRNTLLASSRFTVNLVSNPFKRHGISETRLLLKDAEAETCYSLGHSHLAQESAVILIGICQHDDHERERRQDR